MLTVAVVGRPNVGKSTLFNKLVGQRLSIVDDTPGVTRDRIYGRCEWQNREFTLIDTGGIEPKTNDTILAQMREQALLAIESADAVIFVTDLTSGVTADDMDVASMLIKSGKPVIPAVNKSDSVGAPPPELYEFYNLGLGDPIAVSAVHGHGTGDLMDAIAEALPDDKPADYDEDAIKVALIGKPNVGKSSLINFITGEERSIVSDIAGTTRDAVDSTVERDGQKYLFIDTAGMRRKAKVKENIEHFSVLRAHMAVERADVCVIMIDAAEGVTEQDSKVAGIAHENGKACVIAVNKWDAVEGKTDKSVREFTEKVRAELGFMTYAPVVFISAKTGQRVDKLFELIKLTREQHSMRISTGVLNDMLSYATSRVQPPSDKGKRLKLYYMTQASTNPPNFVVFCNSKDLFHYSYQRYIENQIRDTFGLDSTPIRLTVRERGE